MFIAFFSGPMKPNYETNFVPSFGVIGPEKPHRESGQSTLSKEDEWKGWRRWRGRNGTSPKPHRGNGELPKWRMNEGKEWRGEGAGMEQGEGREWDKGKEWAGREEKAQRSRKWQEGIKTSHGVTLLLPPTNPHSHSTPILFFSEAPFISDKNFMWLPLSIMG